MGESTGSFRNNVLLALAGVLTAAGVVAAYMVFSGATQVGGTHKLKAALPTAASLTPGSRVTMAGAQVGRVTKVYRQGYATVVDMSITDERVWPVTADTRVTLNQRTPVGENYISLTPGSSKVTLSDDSVLRMRQADEYVDVDQLLSVLQGRSKDEARRLIQGVGGALDDHGEDLNVVLGRASQVVQASGHIFVTLQRNKAQTAQLVDRLGRVSAAVSERDAAIEEVAGRGLVSLRSLASRDEQLAKFLEVLPSTLAQTEKTSGILQDTAVTATPVVTSLAASLRALRPAVANLDPAVATGRRVVAELGRAAPRLRTTLDEATRLAGPLSAAMPDLNKTLCQVNPMVRFIAPYAKDLLSPLIGLGSASNSYDAIGHVIRLQAVVGENSAVGLPEEVSRAMHTLTRTGVMGKWTPLTWHPYPGPGKLGLESANPDGPFIYGPKDLKASGYTFPRVKADC